MVFVNPTGKWVHEGAFTLTLDDTIDKTCLSFQFSRSSSTEVSGTTLKVASGKIIKDEYGFEFIIDGNSYIWGENSIIKITAENDTLLWQKDLNRKTVSTRF